MENIDEYVKQALKKGYSISQIREILRKNGVLDKDIEKVMKKQKKFSFKILIFFILVLSIAVFLIVYIRMGGWAFEKKEENISETFQAPPQPAFILGAAREKNLSVCDGLNSSDVLLCKILASSLMRDESFCNEEMEKISFVYVPLINSSVITLGANDYCWIKLSETKRADFCSNIEDFKGKDLCTEQLNFLVKNETK